MNKKTESKSKTAVALGMDHSTVSDDLARHFHYTLGRDRVRESHTYLYNALALTIRDRLIERWRNTRDVQEASERKNISYLSLEFLMGRALSNAALNLDLEEAIRSALVDYGCSIEEVVSAEHDAGLGNGGLGRLAACFLDSCASLDLPVTGYGIRYQYGMFHQKIENGTQIECPDHWLSDGNPWEVAAHEHNRRIKFFGHTETYVDNKGREHKAWVNTSDVQATAFDVPIPGYRNNVVNTLRLWKAEATDELNLADFNAGSYIDAVAQKNMAEQITMVLYPNDASENGKELRLRQQYFLSSASLQDVLCRWVEKYGEDFTHFASKNGFQLNDTHPAVAVAELMRLLMDDYYLEWDQAWAITQQTMAYTNHTLLPEALERWPVRMFQHMLPRLLEIIYEINARFLNDVAHKWPGCHAHQRDMSIIEEGPDPQIRMAYLAIVGSFSVNGVAALHTELLKAGLFKQFYQLWPEKFNNKTNGVTPRRWLAHCNHSLSALISDKIGSDWVMDFKQIEKLKPFAKDKAFQKQWAAVKLANKQVLAGLMHKKLGIEYDPTMMFDVQVKRIHEYKRQLLNIMHVIHLYNRILKGDTANMVPRCVIIGGKAAPGYFIAKLIIRLINAVADMINTDERAKPFLRVAFVPNYNVSAMEKICPATDLSEQISTAGKEASGTGNMKFMMNGAITIGTLDGANIEIREEVGDDNFVLFGLSAAEVEEQRKNYDPNAIINNNEHLKDVMALLESGHFNLLEPGLYQPIINSIRDPHDQWLTAADFASYVAAQERVNELYKDQQRWTEISILNTASSAKFSSDRTMQDYNNDIWKC